MGRICAVRNCQARKKELGIAHAITVFRIPKKNNALETWSKAIGQLLCPTDVVCALHFSDANIISETTTVMNDGAIHVMPYFRKRLAPHAIPETIVNEENVESHLTTETSVVQHEPTDINELPSSCGTEQTSNAINVFSGQTNIIESNDNLNTNGCNTSGIAPTDIEAMEVTNRESSNCCSETCNNLNETVCNARRGASVNVDLMDVFTERSNSCCEDDSNCSFVTEEENDDEPKQFIIEELLKCVKGSLPENWCWTTNRKAERSIVFILMDPYTCTATLRLVVYNDLSVTISTADEKVSIKIDSTIASMESLEQLLRETGEKLVCSGTGMMEARRDQRCLTFVDLNEKSRFTKAPRCRFCRALRKVIGDRTKKNEFNQLRTRYLRSTRALKVKKRSCTRLRKKVNSLRQDITEAHLKCAAVRQEALDDAVSEFPDAQKEAFYTCVAAAKVNRMNQMRYTSNWVYECLLMRIKSSKLYDHLRDKKILPLPCKDTINRYIQKLDTSCGFQKPVFDCLRLKSSSMELVERRGVILVDEVALSEAINLDRKTMKFNGFVDLGNYTPHHLQNERADHALVFMLQPLRGVWIQVLGSFLSRRSVTSEILHKLLMECLIRIEEAGFFVDAIAMDGAQWNRGVWTLLGVNPNQVSCEHPCNSKRRLWMLSDFPHLVKTFRTGILKAGEFETPDGMVKIDHFAAVIDYEGYAKPNMSIAYKLTPTHLAPKGYQVMNVPLAFELFSHQVSVAMEVLRHDPRCPRLQDSLPTIKFIKLIGNLIDAMMSRKPRDALRPYNTCTQKKVPVNFCINSREICSLIM